MENKPDKTFNLQKKSHEVLLKLLNNIGIVGAILAAIADIAFVLIMVLGVQINVSLSAIIIFAVVNALIGLMINILLRYQGQKYAELENDDLCKRFYNKRIREKKYLSMSKWFALQTTKDVLIKGATTCFSIFGLIYISITGSKNPIQILITVATLILFACFGMISMNSAYCRFYNVQVPYMNMVLENRNLNKCSDNDNLEVQNDRIQRTDVPKLNGTSGLEHEADREDNREGEPVESGNQNSNSDSSPE